MTAPDEFAETPQKALAERGPSIHDEDARAIEFPANRSYPLLKKFRPRSYLIIFNLNGTVSYRDRAAGRMVNSSDLS